MFNLDVYLSSNSDPKQNDQLGSLCSTFTSSPHLLSNIPKHIISKRSTIYSQDINLQQLPKIEIPRISHFEFTMPLAKEIKIEPEVQRSALG